MIQKITDLTTEPELGKFYLVPTVQIRSDIPAWHLHLELSLGQVLPVLLPLHTDKEAVRFSYPHFHIDHRFLLKRDYNKFLKSEKEAIRPGRRASLVITLELVANEIQQLVSETPTFKKMKCLREPLRAWPTVPFHSELEALMADKKVVNHICPHRGVSMAGCKVEVGKRICPAHGLVWDAETGELITGELAKMHRKDQMLSDAVAYKTA